MVVYTILKHNESYDFAKARPAQMIFITLVHLVWRYEHKLHVHNYMYINEMNTQVSAILPVVADKLSS